jgi:hypothetical protein
MMENRRFPRIYTSLPAEIHLGLPEVREKYKFTGVLINFSLGGLYFTCKELPPLEKGDIRDLAFNPTPPQLDNVSFCKAQAKVVRIEPLDKDSVNFGVAVEFISPLALEIIPSNKPISNYRSIGFAQDALS